MCLGVPGKIIQKYDREGLPYAQVDFGGIAKEICLAYVPEAEVGEYVIVHVGFAISRLDEAEAMEQLALLREMEAAGEESPWPPVSEETETSS
ncbi:[NiFe] hydrogenase metallocenter assembly protein HypC [Thermogutta terrifontis]|uniref:[NiFe] hydrogenase metallocenter assembly protein HypC n=1 Tax=Thermogutta terrifontis TaxID=1331910 RepID=A0A286RB50_9BACT|nr:HypC/HybG/HupF family hydrogenase formation chaperone [Thermogutta terrifontis]ASV73188.1 [NiFe] hydrogenase metallocenter assembly protein HypC [Thermogutta terrifontis]